MCPSLTIATSIWPTICWIISLVVTSSNHRAEHRSRCLVNSLLLIKRHSWTRKRWLALTLALETRFHCGPTGFKQPWRSIILWTMCLHSIWPHGHYPVSLSPAQPREPRRLEVVNSVSTSKAMFTSPVLAEKARNAPFMLLCMDVNKVETWSFLCNTWLFLSSRQIIYRRCVC